MNNPALTIIAGVNGSAESKPFFAFKCVSADFNIFTILCKRTLANLLPQCV
jgi:hypothetical protein